MGFIGLQKFEQFHFITDENDVPYVPCSGKVWVQKQQGACDIYQF